MKRTLDQIRVEIINVGEEIKHHQRMIERLREQERLLIILETKFEIEQMAEEFDVSSSDEKRFRLRL